MQAFVDGMMKEVKLIPYTAVVVLGLVGLTTAYVIPSLQHAEAAGAAMGTAVRVLRHAVGSMGQELLRNRIATLDSRLSALEIEKARIERLGQPAPAVITELLRRATTERALAEQELGALLMRGQDADSP